MSNHTNAIEEIPATCRVECFMRAPTGSTRPSEENIIERLQRLKKQVVIDDYIWHVWNKEVCLASPADRTASSEVAIEKYREFRRWAAQHDRRLTPFFAERTVASSLTDEEYEVVAFPVIAIAVYDGETLRDLAPTVDTDRPYSVKDCLATLSPSERTSPIASAP